MSLEALRALAPGEWQWAVPAGTVLVARFAPGRLWGRDAHQADRAGKAADSSADKNERPWLLVLGPVSIALPEDIVAGEAGVVEPLRQLAGAGRLPALHGVRHFDGAVAHGHRPALPVGRVL